MNTTAAGSAGGWVKLNNLLEKPAALLAAITASLAVVCGGVWFAASTCFDWGGQFHEIKSGQADSEKQMATMQGDLTKIRSDIGELVKSNSKIEGYLAGWGQNPLPKKP